MVPLFIGIKFIKNTCKYTSSKTNGKSLACTPSDLTHQPKYFMGEKNTHNYFKHIHIIFELTLLPYHVHKYCPNQTSMNVGAQETEGLPE